MADESSSVRLNDAAVLLGVQAEDLARALTTKVIDVQGTVRNLISPPPRTTVRM